MIKLGEALTFCRDQTNKDLCKTGIVQQAIACSKVRNILVPHLIYDNPLIYNYEEKKKELVETLASINIEALEVSLDSLRNSKIEELEKPAGTARNNFPFPFYVYIKSLTTELAAVNNYLNSLAAASEGSSEQFNFNIALQNHVRNVCMIMLDLIDENHANLNKSLPCRLEKIWVKKFNDMFQKEYPEFIPLFSLLQTTRVNLSHLVHNAPIIEKEQILEFAQDLNKMRATHYVDKLNNFLKEKEKNKVSKENTNQNEESLCKKRKIIIKVFPKEAPTLFNTNNQKEKFKDISNLTRSPDFLKLVSSLDEVKSPIATNIVKKTCLVDYDYDSDQEIHINKGPTL